MDEYAEAKDEDDDQNVSAPSLAKRLARLELLVLCVFFEAVNSLAADAELGNFPKAFEVFFFQELV
jgi:hypothetical protein